MTIDVKGDIYGSPDIEYTSTGAVFNGETSIDDTQIQESANGSHVTPDDLTGYHNHGVTKTYLEENAALYRVRKNTPTYDVAVSRTIVGVTGIITTGDGLLAGINLYETAGATALANIRRGLDINQAPILTVALAANASMLHSFPTALEYKGGLFLELVSGHIGGYFHTIESRNV